MGSGIQTKRYSDITTWLRHRWFKLATLQSVPTILDAGALHLAGSLEQPTVITPHSGELSKLLSTRGLTVTAEAIEGNPKKWVQEAADTLGVTVLLKGSTTYVANDSVVIELPTATPWLATAGTGDVLAGIIGSLVATNTVEILNDYNHLAAVVASAAFIHARAADAASNRGPINAEAIIDSVPSVIARILK
jgi:NAD(P)H-hydrate repair Nnr-like enzyme with NAD(P)H-hydrate dehydratase domain